MSFKSFLILMALATSGAWIAWALVLNGVDPSKAGWMGLVLFYLTLSIALFGSLSVGGIAVRLWRNATAVVQRVTIDSSRQALLFTALCIFSLLLFSNGWFRWWTMLLCVLIAGLIELLFQSKKYGVEH